MAFWGVEIKPGKSYTHTYDSEHGRLRISQATLGIGKSTNKSSLQCKVGNKRPILLCNLIPNVSETCSLELEFEEDEEVVFSVIGQTSIHLSGYYLGGATDGDDSDSYGEDITAFESSESSGSSDEEDEYDAEFIDDDMEMFPPSPPKSSVIIEEIEEDGNLSNEKVKEKKKKKENKKNPHGISDDANAKQLVVSNGNAVPESEDEDGFPVSSLSTKKEQEETLKAEKSCEEIPEKTTVESNKGEKENDVAEKNTFDGSGEKDKKKKKKKNKKVTVAEAVAGESVEIMKEANDAKDTKEANGAKDTKEANDAMDQDQAKATDPTPAEDASVKQKRKNKKKRAKEDKDANEDSARVVEVHESDAKKTKKEEDMNTGKDITPNAEQGIDTKVSKSGLKTRTHANGLVIEEIAMGKPDGKRAIPGKKVSVNYVGKLLKTGDVFDSNVGKKPFQFRLGIGQVIKGWDVGVNGMRVGDKRKLIIPPSYAYGDVKTGPIPADSWLSFDVELVSVQ